MGYGSLTSVPFPVPEYQPRTGHFIVILVAILSAQQQHVSTLDNGSWGSAFSPFLPIFHIFFVE